MATCISQITLMPCSTKLARPRFVSIVNQFNQPNLSPSQSFFKRYGFQPSSISLRCQASAAPSSPAASPPLVELDEVLQRMQDHACCVNPVVLSYTTVISGTGLQLGMEVTWTLSIRGDGAFREEVSSPFVSFYSGFDGTPDGTAWDVDSSGVCHQLQLDDHEASVLVAWVRSGVWTLPHLRSRLDIQLAPDAQNDAFDEDSILLRVRLRSGHVTAFVALNPATWRPCGMVLMMSGDKETWEFKDWKVWNEISWNAPCPERYLHQSMNGGEQYLDVHSVTAHHDHYTASSLIESSSIATAAGAAGCRYNMPEQDLLPSDATFLPGVPSAVPVWYTRSGHMLARATINGDEKCGYFIVDTGASGFVVEPAAADTLDLEAFGVVHVTGMAGKIKGKFRRAETFQLGPLQVKNAVMMEMPCGGLVTGAPGPVIGIVGFEIFRRSVVDIPAMIKPKNKSEEETERSAVLSPAAALAFSAMNRNTKSTSRSADPNTPHAYIHLHHPEEADPVLSMLRPEDWLPVTMLSLLPHISVTLQPPDNNNKKSNNTPDEYSNENASANNAEILSSSSSSSAAHSALLMVDTGAGGMGAVLNSKAASALGLVQGRGGARSIRGVGGSTASSVTLKSATLGLMKIGGVEFEEVQCLVAGEGAGGGASLSYYSGGILCGEVLGQCRLVMDLSRGRMAVLSAQKIS